MPKRLVLQITISVLWVILLGSIAGAIIAIRWYNTNLQPANQQQTSRQRFEIVRGSNLDEVAINLHEQGLIKDAAAFKWHLRLNGRANSLQAGVFELSPADYASEIAETLNSATLANLDVIVYPEQRLDQIEDSLVEQGFERIDVQIALQLENYSDHKVTEFIPQGADLEGYIAPETFAVDQFNTDSAERVIRGSLDVFVDNLTDDIQKGILKNFDTVHKGVILASIVEVEVGPEYRNQAAQVFIKRLKEDQKLESDVTFVYAAAVEGGPIGVDNPSLYNTRKHPGLPPGPIGNVSKSSLQAVAFPAETDFLFFVSGDDGVTYFNETYEEHLEDVAEYCIQKCKLPTDE